MQWADGEGAPPSLGGDEHGEASPADTARGEHVAQLMQVVGGAVRDHYQAVADKHEASIAALWTEIARELPPPIAASAAPGSRGAGHAASAGVWRYVVTGVISAAAASLLTWGLAAKPAPIAARVGDLPGVEVQATPSPVQVTPASFHQPPTIESLEVAGGSGTVITVEDANGGTAVIWITPNDIGEAL